MGTKRVDLVGTSQDSRPYMRKGKERGRGGWPEMVGIGRRGELKKSLLGGHISNRYRVPYMGGESRNLVLRFESPRSWRVTQ